jgi:hypothetical protein
MKSKEEDDEESQIRDMKCVFFANHLPSAHRQNVSRLCSSFASTSQFETKIMILLRYTTWESRAKRHMWGTEKHFSAVSIIAEEAKCALKLGKINYEMDFHKLVG